MGNDYVRPTELRAYRSGVKPSEVTEPEISFNWKRLVEVKKKFTFGDRDKKYFLKLLERLKNLSNMNRTDLIKAGKSIRCHPIDFNDTCMSTFGFDIENDQDAWQLSISEHQHGRIHGYFVSNVFYVVWLDPEHNLYKK